ncbi:hypothetical protein [Lysinibacter cavernae]|uniref:DNA-binding transcriptional regulator PaaX n=1 Tax=Lysinibacter cavernae TaxID=1640652 RepID=A0A7X5TUQ0_9MICO|nr:hypothetical protein [Lysinibacter cavernae]NIH54789.1 DNA-binding transcriptional regulator PaaX [Lysinibacter cavernae]
MDDASVRLSVSPLKRRGIVESVKRDNVAAYRLPPALEVIFVVCEERIYHPKRAPSGDPRLLTSYSVVGSGRMLQHGLGRC